MRRLEINYDQTRQFVNLLLVEFRGEDDGRHTALSEISDMPPRGSVRTPNLIMSEKMYSNILENIDI
jgi:hypothetical protein